MLVKRVIIFLVIIVLSLPLYFWQDFNNKSDKVQAADFNSSVLISDGEFISINSISAAEIQSFLASKNSYLKDFSEGGRSAAQIIYDASVGYGDASGSINGITINSSTGTVSPKVLLVTLQKEQSLISKTSRDDNALNKAMGYACPDGSGCNPTYAGFTKQIENAAWQFRYNYERAAGRGFSDYQVGQSFNFDNDTGAFSNRATASLYRYTPHVYNGNYNFWNLYYNTYNFTTPLYAYQWVTAGPYSGDGSARDPISPGRSAQIWVVLRNTGSETWYRSGVNATHLGMTGPQDRTSAFTSNRGMRMVMDEVSVAPGATGTFILDIVAPDQPGDYWEHFAMVVEQVKWVGGDLNWFIKVGNTITGAQYLPGGQEPHTADAKIHLSPGQTTTLTVRFVNRSGANWYRNTNDARPIYLGNSQPHDRRSVFEDNENNRGFMRETGVGYGETATFDMDITAPNQKGTYREYFDLVVEHAGWINTGLYWDIIVE